MTTTLTEVDGHPAEIHQQEALVENTIANLVHDLRRAVNERNKRAIAASRARERVKESNEQISGLVDEICRLDEKHGQAHLIEAANAAIFEDDDEDEGDDEEEFDEEE